jgi:eukaryotic-like serine/threonine-protein kinase
MPDDPRIQELLDELLDRETTPEEVCGACTELLPVVRRRWGQICRARAELDALLPVWPNGSPPTPPEELPLPEVPGYKVEAVLGHGGMGVVFRARHLRLGRLVALKMTLAGFHAGTDERERFRREAEAVAALRHANVVQVYDFGDWAGRPYFTMELIEGGSLAQRQASAPQTAHQAAALLAILAEAVHAAHQGGIVHRDLKPANILFTPDGTPKITDFGLARRLEGGAALTLSGVPLGTPSYMAPEQARGQSRETGPSTDVYALGAILYELLTGRPPFRGQTPTETLQLVIHHEPVPPSRLNRKTPRDLETICLTCLQKEPRLRYVSAAALADDLRRFLQGEAIAARPEVRLVRWVRRACRQPLLSGAVALAVLATLGLVGGGLWLFSDRSAKGQAAYDDVRDMVSRLHESSWLEARAARDRANGRLGTGAPAQLRRLIDRGTRDLELAARLDAIHSKGVEEIAANVRLATYDKEFAEAFRAADLGTVGDDPETVASRIRESDIRGALIAALDRYSLFMSAQEPGRSAWALAVAGKADTDQSSWRHRARDLNVLGNPAALKDLMATMPRNDPSVIPLRAIQEYGTDENQSVADRLAILKRLHEAHPGDFWLNLQLGGFLRHHQMNGEALGYLQAATSLRPESSIARSQFGGVLADVGRREESAEQYRRAAEINPLPDFYHQEYVRGLSELGRLDAAVEHLHDVLRAKPNSALFHTELGKCAERQGREKEALVYFTKAVELDATLVYSQQALRNYLLKRGRLNDMRVAWQAALAAGPPEHDAWYGYAELCLFLNEEGEYLRARRELLTRYGATTDPNIAERTSRACLLLPATGDELAAATALSERALAVGRIKNEKLVPYFLFARGLAEFRQGHFDEAIAIMKGDASRVMGPAPRLVLAMALHQKGQQQEARRTLAAAVTARDWRPALCVHQDAWIHHVLRREAERQILPNLSAFLAGTYRPTDNDERLALVGICQFEDRTVALAHIYADAFAADPGLTETSRGHRYAAAKAAARAGSGRGSGAGALGEAERALWRGRAIDWLKQELVGYSKTLDNRNDRTRPQVLQRLRQWQTEGELAELRESVALNKLPPDERRRCLELWAEVRGILARHGNTP